MTYRKKSQIKVVERKILLMNDLSTYYYFVFDKFKLKKKGKGRQTWLWLSGPEPFYIILMGSVQLFSSVEYIVNILYICVYMFSTELNIAELNLLYELSLYLYQSKVAIFKPASLIQWKI